MAKLTAVVLILTALAAVASASSYTTVVTTRVREESCKGEVEEQMPMRHCEMWVQSAPPLVDGFLRSGRFEEEHKEECCSELRQLSSKCRCEAVREMMMDMPQLEMKRMACSLPSRCGMSACACPRLLSAA